MDHSCNSKFSQFYFWINTYFYDIQNVKQYKFSEECDDYNVHTCNLFNWSQQEDDVVMIN